ncbi:hypothetical protein HYALB_00013791 [Hymenoscyphus albidus]|uniref:DNA replication checkpoint mediator MRC1 domain-containing protein n=1 Tax=Hymenoscyphus albidus TaxID=595503 RepID=A0A9N9LUG7_9HELO|nr:hypothetical protein HYALB_00013791 [Hymenoscyphus albidus]
MSSTRESSPAVESNPTSPTQLTPTSKVKALLARFDDSDDESVSGSARKRVATALTKPRPKSKSPAAGSFEDALTNTNASKTNDSTDDDEEDIVRPKGRLAARMHANLHASEDVENSGNARDRVRKMLAAKSKSPKPTSGSDKASSDDSDAPVVSRKRKIRTTRRESPRSSPERREPSPGLFVSPSKAKAAANSANEDSDSELPAVDDDRFKALVQRKREERLAREAETAKEKARKLAERRKMDQQLGEDDDMTDDDAERRLTQPTRKASKKAGEEIRRETQRMSRNQQLAHKPVTKKNYAKADFLAKFNVGPQKEASDPVLPTSSSSPAPQSDVEMKETPPSSPSSVLGETEKSAENSNLAELAQDAQEEDEEMPTLEDALSRIPSSPPTRVDKGKGRAVREPTAEPEMDKEPVFAQRPVRVRISKVDKKTITLDDSDSDLEIVSVKTPNRQRRKINSIFDRIPERQAKESHSIQALRTLALVKSPGKPTGKNKKPSMTTGELQLTLQQKARQQAAREREERLQELRAKGVIIQTAEEREQEMAEVEDLIAKARREGEEIMKREKAASKKERKANGETDPLGDDSSDDEDWEEDKVPDAELSLSGSDDEEEGPENSDGDASGKEEEGDDEPVTNPMFDNEASESDAEEEEADLTIPESEPIADIEEDDLEQAPIKVSRRIKQRVVSDDEDDESHDESYSVPQTQSPKRQSPKAPTSVLRSATKTFIPGVTVAGPAGLGLTQIFAGTMDESQVGDEASQVASNFVSQPKNNRPGLDFLRGLPAPDLPDFVPTMEEDTQDQDMIMNSQPETAAETQGFESMPGLELGFSQSQSFDSLVQDSQTPFPEATQDFGYQQVTPIRGRFVDPPPSTVDTVMLDPSALPETNMETPIVKKKGKLRQRNRVASFSDDDMDKHVSKVAEEEDFEITANMFDVMRKASKKKKKAVVDDFDKKNSKAKDMVHEQADESEDEYTGLGGASDDESGGEADAFVKEMIDDESKQHVDENELAAFFADRERARDEKEVEKLYKDVTNGMLRRKRGADYDLSDSDDGGEAQRRRKRAKFAKMQKALLADERIGKIAENPKSQAFLRAIEDRGSGDEVDFLDDFAEVDEADSQSQSQDGSTQVIPNSQPGDMGPPPPKGADPGARLPANPRRMKPGKKPANLSEIRESLSSLIEEPNSLISSHSDSGSSDDELGIEGEPSTSTNKKENRDPFALRRTQNKIVDRISLKRQSSSSLSSNTKLAFSTSNSNSSGFKVPALLRRATTNNSVASTTSSVGGSSGASNGMERSTLAVGGGSGGGRNKGVTGNYVARESERNAKVLEGERRRERRLVKGAEGRRKVVGGLLGGGKFE